MLYPKPPPMTADSPAANAATMPRVDVWPLFNIAHIPENCLLIGKRATFSGLENVGSGASNIAQRHIPARINMGVRGARPQSCRRKRHWLMAVLLGRYAREQSGL
jgi:hypothetical protein